MEAIRRQPYPTTPVDTSVFEELSEEYNIAAPNLPYRVQLSSDQLVSIVRSSRQDKAQWDRAEAIRTELVEASIDIPHHEIYEMAAKQVLMDSNRADRALAFANWFSLYPDARSCPRRRSFTHICHLLFHQPYVPELPVIMRFGQLCASKGYAMSVCSQVIPCVVRFSEPSVSHAFVEEFWREALRYSPDLGAKSRISKRIYDLATRTQCLSGRLDASVEVLQTARRHGIDVSPSVATLLLRQLKENGSEGSVKIVEDYISLSFPDSYSHDTTSLSEAYLDVEKAESNAPRWTNTTYLAQILRTLRKSILSPTPPQLSTLTDFIVAYRATGHDRAVAMLRRKAFRHSLDKRAWWLMAELHYHHTRKQWRSVLITFANYFYLIGVPPELVQSHLDSFSTYRRSQRARHRFPNLLLPPLHPLDERLWPTPFHTALVWSALIGLSRGSESLERLYRQLLDQADSLHSPSSLTADNVSHSALNLPPNRIYPSPSDRVEEAHFTPFFREFAIRSGLQRAAHVLVDMRNLGISPNVHHWTALAIGFARAGEAAKALSILARMEVAGEGESARVIPPPTIVTYTGMMRGFVKAGNLGAALDVERRMMANVGYITGSNVKTEEALTTLRELEHRRRHRRN